MNHFSKRIKEKRKELKLTQKELADLVNVSSQVISNWERGYTTPNTDDLSRLAAALKVTPNFLIGDNLIVNENEIDHIYPDNVIKEFDSFVELNSLMKKYGIEQMGFLDIDKWKKLTPEDIKLVEEHFKMIVKIANERNKED